MKSGPDEADLGKLQGAPIACDVGVLLTALPNGHSIMQFSLRRGEKVGPLGFGGTAISHTANRNFAVLPVAHIYPRKRLGASPEETYADALGGKPLDGEGFCFFGQDIAKSTSVDCVSKVESRGEKIVFTVRFKVDKVSIEKNLSNDFSFSR